MPRSTSSGIVMRQTAALSKSASSGAIATGCSILPERNFPWRPGVLHFFEGGVKFDRVRSARGKALENSVGFGCEIAAIAYERIGGRINGHIQVGGQQGSQAQIIFIKNQAGVGEKYPVASLQSSPSK